MSTTEAKAHPKTTTWSCPSTPLEQTQPLDQLEGEIINGRYVMLEPLGRTERGHSYQAYDMERLVRFTAEVSRAESGQVSVADRSAPPPIPQPPPTPAAPPPIPLTAGTPPADALPRRGRLPTCQLEAAWFARCTRLEEEQEAGEVADYLECQAELEQEAVTLTRERYQRFALEGAAGPRALAAALPMGALQLPADAQSTLLAQLHAFAFGSRTRSLVIGAGIGLLLGSMLLL